MWPESSSVNAVNLVKNLLQFQRYRIFPKGLLFLARPVDYSKDYFRIVNFPLLWLQGRAGANFNDTVKLADLGNPNLVQEP